jgi:hypothetical protein
MKSAVELPSCCVSRHNSPRFEYSLLDRYLLTFPARSLTGLDLEPGACYFVPRLGIPRAQTQVDISRDNSQSGLDLEMFSFLLSNLEISSSERLKICPARIHEWRNDRSPLSLWPSTRTARAGIASTSRARCTRPTYYYNLHGTRTASGIALCGRPQSCSRLLTSDQQDRFSRCPDWASSSQILDAAQYEKTAGAASREKVHWSFPGATP